MFFQRLTILKINSILTFSYLHYKKWKNFFKNKITIYNIKIFQFPSYGSILKKILCGHLCGFSSFLYSPRNICVTLEDFSWIKKYFFIIYSTRYRVERKPALFASSSTLKQVQTFHFLSDLHHCASWLSKNYLQIQEKLFFPFRFVFSEKKFSKLFVNLFNR